MANVENLQRTLDHITAHPENHRQQAWAMVLENGEDGTPVRVVASSTGNTVAFPSCGTNKCLAGWATTLHGWTMIGEEYNNQADHHLFKVIPDAIAKRIDQLDDHEIRSHVETIEYQGRVILGLDAEEADALFFGANELPHLWALAYAVTDGQIKLPGAFPRGKDETIADWSQRVGLDINPGGDPHTPGGVAKLVDEAMQQLHDGWGNDVATAVVDEYGDRCADKIGSGWLLAEA